ncbi:hypothetical protein ACW9HQ_42500, partial [Nocardia gipuzkoensis]
MNENSYRADSRKHGAGQRNRVGARQSARRVGTFDRLASDEVLSLTPREAAVGWTAALAAACARRADEDPAAVAAGLIAGLPVRMIVALHRFRTLGSAHNALLVRGMCADPTGLPATPAT